MWVHELRAGEAADWCLQCNFTKGTGKTSWCGSIKAARSAILDGLCIPCFIFQPKILLIWYGSCTRSSRSLPYSSLANANRVCMSQKVLLIGFKHESISVCISGLVDFAFQAPLSFFKMLGHAFLSTQEVSFPVWVHGFTMPSPASALSCSVQHWLSERFYILPVLFNNVVILFV